MSTETTTNSARAVARHVRVTPMKARRVVDIVRGKSVEEALAILKFAPQAAAEPVAKVIASPLRTRRTTTTSTPARSSSRLRTWTRVRP